MVSAKFSILSGSVLAFLSVAFGAFGAHALRDFLVANQRLSTYETAVQYQFFHALGLILVGLIGQQFPSVKTDWVSTWMLLGILVFSGSLFLLCLTGIKWLGAITPLGGLCFLASWGLLAFRIWKL